MYYLDYSQHYPSISSIINGGYGGVIRYITDPPNMQPPNPGNPKHITTSEYDALVAAKLDVWLIYQGSTTDADGGYSLGQRNARRALTGCTQTLRGHESPIFFTNDRTTLPNPSSWRGYLDGAASVLGIERVGAYGFGNAMDAAVGHASYFWQAGRRSDVRDFAHIWQDNNFQPNVGGVSCDRNLILKDIPFFPSSHIDPAPPVPVPEPIPPIVELLHMELNDVIYMPTGQAVTVRDILIKQYMSDTQATAKSDYDRLSTLMLVLSGQAAWGSLTDWGTLSTSSWAKL